jgi:hypothetical protein
MFGDPGVFFGDFLSLELVSWRSHHGAVTRGWYVRVVGVTILGAIASLIVGGFVALFLGIALVALFNGGSTTGNVDHAVWLASVVVGPLIVGFCTGGLAAIFQWPRQTLKRRTVVAVTIVSAVMAEALLGGHTNGSIRFLGQPWWWALYVVGVLVPTALAVGLGRGRQETVEASAAPRVQMSGPRPGWFPDPFLHARWRWWDGTQWTHHEAD